MLCVYATVNVYDPRAPHAPCALQSSVPAGEVGDWKNWFSVADNERFQRTVSAKLRHSALAFRYDLEPAESTWL